MRRRSKEAEQELAELRAQLAVRNPETSAFRKPAAPGSMIQNPATGQANDEGAGLPHGRPAPSVAGLYQGSAQIGEVGRQQCAAALLAGELHRIKMIAVAQDLKMHVGSGGAPGGPDGADHLPLVDLLAF